MSYPDRCQRCSKPAADVDPHCDHAGMPHCIAPRVGQEREVQSLRQQLRGAEEALRFYANEDNWTAQNPPRVGGSPAWRDHGQRARDALGQ